VVFAEACRYGLPILATRTGGVETAVVSGVSGYTFEYHECAGRYANRALELLGDLGAYRSLCMSAFALARELLNWDVCADTWKREMLATS
jgi:glycosyltransferase involved in cell wall biosynthesis